MYREPKFEEYPRGRENLTKCSKCKGERVIKEEFYLLKVCDRCGGYGEIDWIDNMIGRKSDFEVRDFEISIFRSNITRLIALITEMYARTGVEVAVDIKELHIRDRNELSKAFSKAYIEKN